MSSVFDTDQEVDIAELEVNDLGDALSGVDAPHSNAGSSLVDLPPGSVAKNF